MNTFAAIIRIRQPRSRSPGVTLIEVLVGIAIGLIGMLVMFQMVTVWDARTRVSSSTGDAQVAGALAMFNLEQDLRLAGMGFGTATPAEMGCNVTTYDQVADLPRPFPLRPIEIVDGGNASDSIKVLHGNSPFFVQAEQFSAATADTLSATVKYGFKKGDLAVMTDGAGTCRLIEVTDDSTPGPHILSFGTTPYTAYSGAPIARVRYNPTTYPMPAIGAGNLYSLGTSPRLNEWKVDAPTNTLGYINLLPVIDANPFFGIAEGVVSMKAEYGYDSNSDSDISADEWTKVLPVPTDWTKVRAVRVGLLVRSRDYATPRNDGQTAVYKLTDVPLWSGSTNSPFVMKNLDTTTDSDEINSPNNWRYYRYRVFEKVIPLRNMIWGQ